MKDLRNRTLAGLAAFGAAATLCMDTALAEEAARPAPQQASIPFVDHHNIRDWRPDKKQGLWIQDQRRTWYYARVMEPCLGLDWALSIGFDPGGGAGQLDKFSSIIVPGEGRCQITSLTRSDPPPRPEKKKKRTVMEDKPAPASASTP